MIVPRIIEHQTQQQANPLVFLSLFRFYRGDYEKGVLPAPLVRHECILARVTIVEGCIQVYHIWSLPCLTWRVRKGACGDQGSMLLMHDACSLSHKTFMAANLDWLCDLPMEGQCYSSIHPAWCFFFFLRATERLSSCDICTYEIRSDLHAQSRILRPRRVCVSSLSTHSGSRNLSGDGCGNEVASCCSCPVCQKQ